jgi:hypothetical protein
MILAIKCIVALYLFYLAAPAMYVGIQGVRGKK